MNAKEYEQKLNETVATFKNLSPESLAIIVLEALENRDDSIEPTIEDIQIEAALIVEKHNNGWTSFLRRLIQR